MSLGRQRCERQLQRAFEAGCCAEQEPARRLVERLVCGKGHWLALQGAGVSDQLAVHLRSGPGNDRRENVFRGYYHAGKSPDREESKDNPGEQA
jgi:hypothetical protein